MLRLVLMDAMQYVSGHNNRVRLQPTGLTSGSDGQQDQAMVRVTEVKSLPVVSIVLVELNRSRFTTYRNYTNDQPTD